MTLAHKRILRFFLAIIFVIAFIDKIATANDQLQNQIKSVSDLEEKIEFVSKNLLWLRLLHLDAPYTQVQSDFFYLSQKSKQKKSSLFSSSFINSVAELKINLQEAQQNLDYQCQFPARDHFLRQQFPTLAFLPIKSCPVLEKWKKTYNIQSVSIVYPSNSIESPLSIFSHTFLKLNSKNLPKHSNLNLALGFAAEMDHQDGFIKMATKGIFGGYVGRFAMTNYYTEVNRYGEAESRDLFEYELSLSTDEIDFLMKHFWEIKEADFEYYFVNGNCSYHLLTLLEIAKPDLELTKHFRFVTIPITTIKTLLENEKLVIEHSWIPGKLTRKQQMLNELSHQGKAFYRKWKKQQQTASASFIEELKNTSLSTAEQMTLLDLLAESLRNERESSAFRNEVLKLRSQLPTDVKSTHPLPQEMPHLAHGAQMVSGGTGFNELPSKEHWTQFRYRPAFHNLMDPPEGFFPNTSFEIADIRVRYSSQKQFQDSSIALINAFALNPVTEDRQSPAWSLESRLLDFLVQPKWKNQFGIGAGITFGQVSFYSFAKIDSLFDQHEKSGLGVFSGATAGFIANLFDNLKIHSHVNHFWPLQSNRSTSFWEGEVQAAYSLSTEYSLQVNLLSSKENRSLAGEFLFYF